jgi:hypothetical protein
VPEGDNLRKSQRQLGELLSGTEGDAWQRIVETYYFVDGINVPAVPRSENVEEDADEYARFHEAYMAFLAARWEMIREAALTHFRQQGWTTTAVESEGESD